MGIPHLRPQLKPFAKRKRLDGYSMVIDGPGLGYYIQHLYPHAPPTGNTADGLGQMAVTWLGELEAGGVIV